MAHPLSAPLQSSLRFFHLPSRRRPIGSSCELLSWVLPRRATGFPRSTRVTIGWGGRRLFAGDCCSCGRRVASPCTGPVPFWSKPVSTFGLSLDNDVYQRFT